VYDDPGSGGAQLTDWNPGIHQSGLFWTTVLDDDAVDVDLGAGTATYHARDLRMFDYHEFENSVLGNGATPSPGAVSFTVKWTASGAADHFDNPDQHYRGDFRQAVAQMEWTGRSGMYDYRSAPLAESSTDFGILGHESNGSYY